MAKKPSYRNLSAVGEIRDAIRKLEFDEQIAYFARRARADNTQATYASAQRRFLAWCEARGEDPQPGRPGLVPEYLVYLAMDCELKSSSIRTIFAAISRWYRDAVGKDNYTQSDHVRSVLSGIQRTLMEREHQAAALTADLVRRVIVASYETPSRNTIKTLRDRAIVLVGFAGAFRRSEITSLRTDDISFEERGALVMLRSSKTDQLGHGRMIGLSRGRGKTCPIKALRAWLDASPPGDWVFRHVNKGGQVGHYRMTDKSVNLVVKGMVRAAGLDPERYSAHSLRAGMTTDLVAAGLSVAQVKGRTRHQSDGMVSRYTRPATELDVNYTKASRL